MPHRECQPLWTPPVANVEAATLALSPRLPEPPFRRAVRTTAADQAGARVDCFLPQMAGCLWCSAFCGLGHSISSEAMHRYLAIAFGACYRRCLFHGRDGREIQASEFTTLGVETGWMAGR